MKWYRRAVIYLLLIGFTGVLWWAALFQNRNSTGRSLIVTFLDVGQGDCAVIQAPSGRTLLIDAGPRLQRDDAGRRVVWPFLRSQGIHRIDALILTHPDDDHFGGAITLVNRLQITELFTNGMPSDSSLYQYVLRRARRHHRKTGRNGETPHHRYRPRSCRSRLRTGSRKVDPTNTHRSEHYPMSATGRQGLE